MSKTNEIFGECEKHPGWNMWPDCHMCEVEKLAITEFNKASNSSSLFDNYQQSELLEQISRLNDKLAKQDAYWKQVVKHKISTANAYVNVLNRDIEKLKLVLAELVYLKELKDQQGKSAEYLHKQPLAWHKAKKILKDEKN